MSWLELQSRLDGVLCCFKVGWKFALFFDLDSWERDLLKLIAAGWFPFVETIGGDFEALLRAYKDDFNIEEETGEACRTLRLQAYRSVAQRWWKEEHSGQLAK